MLPLQCDVRDVGIVRSCVSSCITEMGMPHIIINASSGNVIAPTERLSPNTWATVVDSTLTGTANVITDVGKRLISAHQGNVHLYMYYVVFYSVLVSLMLYSYPLFGLFLLLHCIVIVFLVASFRYFLKT